ncbi:hypothetical protein [Pontimicrobium aquaticum]|uniref:Uncharacterized protein n=1 Tax=Pontimicrobium aquaticum TaxID=2565367 RepID=A0A4V5LR06_9FLAO|nr:hypothetical protein [Pontimicrobium aquaticum]TJY37389.1 hypothetical protein E5167_05445 [Pontimicrobium aquaticum]
MRKTKYSHKVIAVFLTLNFLTTIIPINLLFANNNGPGSPEAAGFEPVDATDMVNLTNGNLSYVLPLMSVEGFPISMSYHAGITSDLDASWVGLGWYLNPGAINRSVTNTPDDWKKGLGINFTSYDKTTRHYGISVELGITAAASIGVGLNWGGGQGLSGSVNASLGLGSGFNGMIKGAGISGSVSTTGDASIGLGYGGSVVGSLGAGAGVSYSLKSQWNLGAGIGKSLGDNGAYVGAGFSFNGGMSVGGAGNNNTNKAGNSGGVGMSSQSFSEGDASINSQSSGIALPLHVVGIPITLGFKKTKVKINIKKGFRNEEWGALYSSEFDSITSGTSRIVSLPNYAEEFTDYMVREKSMDTYSTRLPQQEEDFASDYTKDIENINFTFLGYDDYNVAAQGLMGNMTPRVFQNASIAGKGQRLKNIDGDNIHVFWHSGLSGDFAQRELGNPDNNYSSNDLYFYFDGQFSSVEKNEVTSMSSITTGTNDLNDIVNEGTHSSSFSNSYGRAKSPTFVEVFTNSQIESGHAASRGLISPATIPNADRDDIDKFDPDGIGGYKVTSPDGKTYHFALPVYHFEQIHRMQIDGQEDLNFDIDDVSEKRQYSRYATHWLLTAITGSDYIDTNSNGLFDKSDYGYWVELEYGKWSDGFVWRSPYQDNVYEYNTNLINTVEDKDKGSYSFGRKQLYYLDKINTKNKTALFVKELRHDAFGKALKFKFTNDNNISIGNTGGGANSSSLNYTDDSVYVRELDVEYKKEYSLKLSKIVLVDGDIGKTLSKNTTGSLGSAYIGDNYSANDTCSPGWESDDFKSVYGTGYTYSIHNESKVLDVNDVSTSFITQNALEVVELNHSYKLAKSSPSSLDANTSFNSYEGKLTLDSVQRKGKGNAEYMPATFFEYYMENKDNISYNSLSGNPSNTIIETEIASRKSKADAWGFLQGTHNGDNAIKAWSLKEITMPTGAKIEINYEEDDYYTEAFSRRYWRNEQLQFRFDDTNGDRYIEFREDPNYIGDSLDFEDYFSVGDEVFLDATYDRRPPGPNNTRYVFVAGKYEVLSIDTVNQIIRIDIPDSAASGTRTDCSITPWYTVERWSEISGAWRSPFNEGYCNAPQVSGTDNTLKKYTLIASRVPEDETGGGLRVSELRTIDNSNTYKVTYDYTMPNSTRSSGITSYAPINGQKYVPYQSEIPVPGVMYEYVTMRETSNSGDYDSETRYRHHVLKPVHNIFNPNIAMEAMDAGAEGEDEIFWAEVTENFGGLDGTNSREVTAKKIDININTALLGQIKSIENLNSIGQVMLKTEYQYINGEILVNQEPNKGYLKETFNSMKSVFESNNDGTTVIDEKRLLSVSSKTEYNNMIKKTITTSGGLQNYIEYSDVDPWLGSFRKSRSKMADGSLREDVRLPAYEKYPDMQSKIIDPANKNMLTQEAMSISKYYDGSNYKTLNASINTWNDSWSYRDDYGVESVAANEDPVWRKHKTFIWKDDVNNTDGSYSTTVNETNDYFNWSTGVPTSSNWQNVSEITRYTHWSSPVETRDINNNFASSKMADNYSKVIASGNARYSEMYYSGAENVASGNTFEGEVLGANLRDSSYAHTGKYSVKNTTINGKTFEISGDVGLNSNDLSKDFRPGKYKVSFWMYSHDKAASSQMGADLIFNSSSVTLGETVEAGAWKQYNYYVDLVANTSVNIYVTNSISIGYYFDDFRMHPVSSNMNSFVYDEETDALKYILDANNMATLYIYDPAGRLCKVYSEVENQTGANGGFKLISENEYYYKGMSTVDCGDCCSNPPLY